MTMGKLVTIPSIVVQVIITPNSRNVLLSDGRSSTLKRVVVIMDRRISNLKGNTVLGSKCNKGKRRTGYIVTVSPGINLMKEITQRV